MHSKTFFSSVGAWVLVLALGTSAVAQEVEAAIPFAALSTTSRLHTTRKATLAVRGKCMASGAWT